MADKGQGDGGVGRWPTALTIAGSDSGGGAGIQADLKTFSAMKVYGMSVLTAITAQNTVGVAAVHPVPVEMVAAQIDAVLEDIGAGAVKTGMLYSPGIIQTVSSRLSAHRVEKLVVDPVMVAQSGDRLMNEDAVAPMSEALLPMGLVVTPNVPEAEVLSGVKIASRQDMLRAARSIQKIGPKNVVIKGGHLRDSTDACDLLLMEDGTDVLLCTERVNTTSSHGTGCTFSAAIAASLALGLGVLEAFERAKDFITNALRGAIPIGDGHGPVDHLWPFRD
jgi:hydroxymethylpyrimidine/phosphomethylpyrimidine kinase